MQAVISSGRSALLKYSRFLLGLLQQVAQEIPAAEIPAALAVWVQRLLDPFMAGFTALLLRMQLIRAWNCRLFTVNSKTYNQFCRCESGVNI